MFQFKEREREFALSLPFCSIWALNGLDDACLHWGGQIDPHMKPWGTGLERS